ANMGMLLAGDECGSDFGAADEGLLSLAVRTEGNGPRAALPLGGGRCTSAGVRGRCRLADLLRPHAERRGRQNAAPGPGRLADTRAPSADGARVCQSRLAPSFR